EAITLCDEEGISPAGRGIVACRRFARAPDAVAVVGLQAAQLAKAANAVDVSLLEERRADDAVQGVGLIGLFAAPFAPPGHAGGRLVGIELQHQRAVVERRDEELPL